MAKRSASGSFKSAAAKAKNKKHNCDPMIRIYEKLVKIRDREKEKEVEKRKEGELIKLIKPAMQEKNMIPEMEKDAAQGQILVNLMYVKNKIRRKWNVFQARQETEDLPSYAEMKKELQEDTQTRVRDLWYDYVGTKVEDKSISRDWKRIIGEPLSDSDMENADADEGVDVTEFATERSSQARKPKTPVPAPNYHSYKYVPYTGPSRKQIVIANAARKKLMDVKFQDAVKKDPRKSCVYDAAIKIVKNQKNTFQFDFNKARPGTSAQNLVLPKFDRTSLHGTKEAAPTLTKEIASSYPKGAASSQTVKEIASSQTAKEIASSQTAKEIASSHAMKEAVSSHTPKDGASSHPNKDVPSTTVKEKVHAITGDISSITHKTTSVLDKLTKSEIRDTESTQKVRDSPKPERSKRPDTKFGSSFSSESTAFEELLMSDGSDSTEKSAAPQSSSEGGEIPPEIPSPTGKKSYKSPATSSTTIDSEIDDSLDSWDFSEIGEGEFELEEEGTMEKVAVYIDPVSDATELFNDSEFGEMGSEIVMQQYAQQQEPLDKATDSFQSSICSFHDPLCPKKSVDSEGTDVCDPYVAYKLRRQAKLDKQKKDEEFRLKLLERLQAVPSDEDTSDEEISSVESEKIDELEEEIKLEREITVGESEHAAEELEEEEIDLEGEFVEGEILTDEIIEEFEAEEFLAEEDEEEVKEVKEEIEVPEEKEEKEEKEKENKKKKDHDINKDLGNVSDLGSSSSSESSESSAQRKYVPPPPPPVEEIDIFAKSRLFNSKYPELFASDASIYPSYTNLKLPYSLICADRNKTRIAQYKKLFRNEIRSLERRHPFAFGGVQLARQFIIGIRVPRQFKDPFTVKERERIEFLLKNPLS